MKLSISFLLMLLPFLCFSQQHFIGIKAGVGFTKINFSDLHYSGQKFRHGVSGGITYDYQANRHFSLGAELDYLARGFRDEVQFLQGNGGNGQKIPVKLRIDYLALPLKATYTVGEKWYGFGSLGLIPSLALHSDATQFDPGTGDHHQETVSTTKAFDFAGMAEIGGGYKLKKYWIYVTVMGNSSFTKYSSVNARHYGIVPSLGMKMPL